MINKSNLTISENLYIEQNSEFITPEKLDISQNKIFDKDYIP